MRSLRGMMFDFLLDGDELSFSFIHISDVPGQRGVALSFHLLFRISWTIVSLMVTMMTSLSYFLF